MASHKNNHPKKQMFGRDGNINNNRNQTLTNGTIAKKFAIVAICAAGVLSTTSNIDRDAITIISPEGNTTKSEDTKITSRTTEAHEISNYQGGRGGWGYDSSSTGSCDSCGVAPSPDNTGMGSPGPTSTSYNNGSSKYNNAAYGVGNSNSPFNAVSPKFSNRGEKPQSYTSPKRIYLNGFGKKP